MKLSNRWTKLNSLLQNIRSACLVAFIAGCLVPLAFAPFNFYLFAIFLPAILFYLWQQRTPRQAAWIGFWFGLGQFGIGISWIYVAINDVGQTIMPIAALLTFLFIACISLYLALLGYLAQKLIQRFQLENSAYRFLLLMPLLWVLTEWLRGWLLTGFPWLNLGYSLIDSPLAPYASVIGVYGLSLLAVLSAGSLFYLATPRKHKTIIVVCLVVVWGGGIALKSVEWTQPTGHAIKVALVQGNLPQNTKWDPDALTERINTYADLTRDNWDADLVVWPENSMTIFYHQLYEFFLQPFNEEARASNTELIIGLPVMNLDTKQYYSSLMTLGGDSSQFYHKTHLVPFGEYLPLGFLRGLINFFNMPMSDFSAGSWNQPLLKVKGQPVAASICYEDAFGEEFIRHLPEATLLVNGSNNAWYGDSLAQHQHLQIARMRALETGRELIRVTTNGISALVDYKGHIVSRSPQFKTHVLRGTVQPRQGATPYVLWGNYPVLIMLITGLAWLWVRQLIGSKR